jgi:excisionase family DNA binding protein
MARRPKRDSVNVGQVRECRTEKNLRGESADRLDLDAPDGVNLVESSEALFDNRIDQLWSNSDLDPTCTILTLPEVAALCRTSLRTIQEAARNGQLPARKIGRTWRCRLDEILDWLKGPQSMHSPEKESPVLHRQQVPNKNLPSWDWSNRDQNLGVELDSESSYSRKHGKVPESSSQKGDTR